MNPISRSTVTMTISFSKNITPTTTIPDGKSRDIYNHVSLMYWFEEVHYLPFAIFLIYRCQSSGRIAPVECDISRDNLGTDIRCWGNNFIFLHQNEKIQIQGVGKYSHRDRKCSYRDRVR